MPWDMIYQNESGIELPDGDRVHTIYVKIKDNPPTMNSESFRNTYIMMQDQLLQDDDCACFLVETNAKQSQNIKWKISVDGNRLSNRRIRRVSLDKFYELVTGEEDAID